MDTMRGVQEDDVFLQEPKCTSKDSTPMADETQEITTHRVRRNMEFWERSWCGH